MTIDKDAADKDAAVAVNKRLWNSLVAVHIGSGFSDVPASRRVTDYRAPVIFSSGVEWSLVWKR